MKEYEEIKKVLSEALKQALDECKLSAVTDIARAYLNALYEERQAERETNS